MSIPRRYLPRSLSRRDYATQRRQVLASRRNYLRGKYTTRKRVKSFHSRPSPYVSRALRRYHVASMADLRGLSLRSGCSVKALRQILRKGRGAYYSNGSRPNQTAQSWANARLASSLTGGPASRVDYAILKSGCSKVPTA